MFLEEGHSNSASQTEQQGQSQIQDRSRANRARRRHSLVDDADVTCIHPRRYTSLFQALQQAFVQLLVGVYFALENVVLNGSSRYEIRLILLLLESFTN